MITRTNQTACPLTQKEREYIRRELDIFFGTLPSVADGFQLRTWRGGPHAGQPKIPPRGALISAPIVWRMRSRARSVFADLCQAAGMPVVEWTRRSLAA